MRMFRLVCFYVCLTVPLLFQMAYAEGEAISFGSSEASIEPISGGRAIVIDPDWEDGRYDLFLMHAGQTERTAVLHGRDVRIRVIPSGHQDPNLLVEDSSGITWYKWTEEALVPLQSWDQYSAVHMGTGGMLFSDLWMNYEIVDLEGNSLGKSTWEDRAWGFEAFFGDADGFVFLLENHTTRQKKVVKTSQNLVQRWHKEIGTESDIDGFFPDGKGGVWLSYEQSYTGTRPIVHINSAGLQDMVYVLGGTPMVKRLWCAEDRGQGTVTVFGTAVADSKGYYTAFSFSLNAENGDMRDMEVRNFMARRDYAIEAVSSADGRVYVRSQSASFPSPMLVPYETLQMDMQTDLLHLEPM